MPDFYEPLIVKKINLNYHLAKIYVHDRIINIL